MAQKHIVIICGEASGDGNAALLVREILKINPDIKISGVGGPLLRKTGAGVYYDIKEFSVIGFFDVIKKLPEFFALKKFIIQKIRQEKPDLVITVDFSGFNLRLAQEINKTVPIFYYTSPQVWASRQGRIKTIKKYITKMIVFFEFEERLYKEYGIDVNFVGHPLLDIVCPSMEKKDFLSKFNLSESKTTVALLPGSRKSEIENILPVMLKVCLLLSKNIRESQFIIAKSPQVDIAIYYRQLSHINLDVKIIEGQTYDCMNSADFYLVASGTATLEAALLQKPFTIIYKMSLLNYLLYRPQVKIPYIGMVNIVAGRKIIPEFIQFRATPENISQEILKILKNPAEISRIKNDLAQVKASLGEPGASRRAARIIMDFLK